MAGINNSNENARQHQPHLTHQHRINIGMAELSWSPIHINPLPTRPLQSVRTPCSSSFSRCILRFSVRGRGCSGAVLEINEALTVSSSRPLSASRGCSSLLVSAARLLCVQKGAKAGDPLLLLSTVALRLCASLENQNVRVHSQTFRKGMVVRL